VNEVNPLWREPRRGETKEDVFREILTTLWEITEKRNCKRRIQSKMKAFSKRESLSEDQLALRCQAVARDEVRKCREYDPLFEPKEWWVFKYCGLPNGKNMFECLSTVGKPRPVTDFKVLPPDTDSDTTAAQDMMMGADGSFKHGSSGRMSSGDKKATKKRSRDVTTTASASHSGGPPISTPEECMLESSLNQLAELVPSGSLSLEFLSQRVTELASKVRDMNRRSAAQRREDKDQMELKFNKILSDIKDDRSRTDSSIQKIMDDHEHKFSFIMSSKETESV